MKKMAFYIALFVIVLMHTVGLCGILFSEKPGDYIALTWVNLLVSSLAFLVYSVILYAERTKNVQGYLLAFVLVGTIGFFAEVLGVKSGKIFGAYAYGNNLGYKKLGVPLIIGVNWGLLVFSVAALVTPYLKNTWAKAAVGATLLVILDVLIEPMALRFDYWNWNNGVIPLQNYVAWWLLSFILLLFCFRFVPTLRNHLGIFMYGIQLIFFSLLHLLLV